MIKMMREVMYKEISMMAVILVSLKVRIPLMKMKKSRLLNLITRLLITGLNLKTSFLFRSTRLVMMISRLKMIVYVFLVFFVLF